MIFDGILLYVSPTRLKYLLPPSSNPLVVLFKEFSHQPSPGLAVKKKIFYFFFGSNFFPWNFFIFYLENFFFSSYHFFLFFFYLEIFFFFFTLKFFLFFLTLKFFFFRPPGVTKCLPGMRIDHRAIGDVCVYCNAGEYSLGGNSLSRKNFFFFFYIYF